MLEWYTIVYSLVFEAIITEDPTNLSPYTPFVFLTVRSAGLSSISKASNPLINVIAR